MAVKAKVNYKNTFTKADKQRAFGGEPIVKKIESESQLAQVLNWYHSSCELDDGMKWVLEYISNNSYSKQEIDIIRRAPNWAIGPTVMWLSRMANNGTILMDRNYEFINNKLNEIIKRATVSSDNNVISVSQRVSEKTQDIIGDIEEQIDLQGVNFKLFDWLKQNNIPQIYNAKIKEYYAPVLAELNMVASGNKEVAEGYKGYTKAKLTQRIAFYNSIINDCKSFEQTKKIARKPRKKKEKTASSLTSRLSYAKSSTEFKIDSINPVTIVGAQTLWVFNVKTRKLGVYHASGPAGLSVKGTTIQGFDEKKSLMKTVRKPEMILPKVTDSGKVYLRKLLDEVKAVAYPMNGRINTDIILIRIS